jgi:tRNA modification GTPase
MHALQLAALNLNNAQSCLNSGAGELLAEELRLAQQHLSEITGEFTSDDLLGEIFSGFCIGK